VCIALFLLFLGSDGAPISNVYIGFNSGSSVMIREQFYGLFMERVDTALAHYLNMDDFTAVQQAMEDMDVLFLCPSDTDMNRSPAMRQLMDDFVSGGGVIIYSAFELDKRAEDVSIWLNDPKIMVQSVKTPKDIDEYYFPITGKSVALKNLNNFYSAKPTNQSLTTTFARLHNDLWGTTYKTFVDPLYWLPSNTRQMILTPANEEFCMFKRNGELPGINDFGDTCWVFDFPHGQGHVVEIAADRSEDYWDFTGGADDFLGILRAAVALRLETTLFPPKERNIVVKRTHGSRWMNLLYDLATDSNVYVWGGDNAEYPFERFLDLTGANSLVVPQFLMYQLARKADYSIRYSRQYEEFIRNGGNMVYPVQYAFPTIRPKGVMIFVNNYLNDYGEFSSYNFVSPTEHNQINQDSNSSAFYYIEYLPKRRNEMALYGLDEFCRFRTSAESGCNLWSAEFGDGHFTFLGWQWESEFQYYWYFPYADYYDPEFQGGRLEDSWPNTNWREALIASLDPSGDPPEYVKPALDNDYLQVETPLNVVVLQRGSGQPYSANANIIRFLRASSHNLYEWVNFDSEALYDLLYHYPDGSMDAIVIPNLYSFSQGLEVLKGGFGSPFDSTTQNMLQEFVDNGGNLVVVGSGGDEFLNTVFNQYLENYRNYFYGYYPSDEYTAILPSPYGMYFESRYLADSLFSPYYTPGALLPFLHPYDTFTNTIVDLYDGLDYCAYVFPFAKTVEGYYGEIYFAYGLNYDKYCAVWSKSYGSSENPGHISAIANSFDARVGSLEYVRAGPWARALNIALGANPNGPSATSTPTPAVSPSMPPSLTPSGSTTPSHSSTPSPEVVSQSNTRTPTVSFSSSSSESASTSESPSGSRSVSPVVSPPLPALSPLPSQAPSREAGASASPIRSAPATKTRSVPPSVAQEASASRSSALVPSSAGDCSSCQIGEAQVAVNSNENVDEQESVQVPLVNELGDPVGNILIPPNFGPDGGALLDVIFVSNVPRSTAVSLGSVILDITLTDSFGNPITELNEPLEICIEGDDSDDPCLSFFNTDTRRWECEDECLEVSGSQVCGKTEHLTSFALLLDGGGGSGGSDDPCNSVTPDYLFAWISLGLVAGAICFVIVAVIAIEIRFRKAEHDRATSFRTMSSRVQSHM